MDAAVFEALPMAVGRVDAAGRLIAANAAWRRMFGGDAAAGTLDYLGACEVAAARGDPAAAGLAAGMREVLDGRREAVSREDYRARSGQPFWFRVDICALPAGGAVIVHTDMTQHHRALDAAEAAARLDPLTGLLNRRAFHEVLQRRLTRGPGESGALLVVDLDGFKAVNDRHGHAAGDLLLCALARRLRHALRPRDEVARMGGDEFLVLIESLPRDQALEPVVQRLRRVLEQPVAVGTERVDVGASIGALTLDDGGDVDGAIAEADRRMYEDKRTRRRALALVDDLLAKAGASS
jgi:diguanylate cyclase (GGDEF)-like protein